jgi:hypothetical protein
VDLRAGLDGEVREKSFVSPGDRTPVQSVASYDTEVPHLAIEMVKVIRNAGVLYY